jgi:hypothetical protein
MRFGVALDLWAKEQPAPVESKPTPKATKELSTATQKMIERINTAGSLVELSEVVPLIQGGEFTEAEKSHLKLVQSLIEARVTTLTGARKVFLDILGLSQKV